MTKVALVEHNKETKLLLNRISEVIFRKTHLEGIPASQEKLTLDNVQFWLSYDKEGVDLFLIYDRPQETWDMEKILYDLEVLEIGAYRGLIS